VLWHLPTTVRFFIGSDAAQEKTIAEPPVSLRIFLVEDSRTIRDNLVPAIEEMAGARVVQVVDGEQDATSWQNTNDDWSTAVVDLLIKDGSGFGVLNALSKRPAGQRAVVLSNYATPSMRAKCLAAGADRVFDKSTEIDAFLDYLALSNASLEC